MKEAYNLLQTYEIFLKLMYLSLIKEFYMQKEYDARGNVKEDDNNYKSTPDASRSYEHDNLNRITSVLLCLK